MRCGLSAQTVGHSLSVSRRFLWDKNVARLQSSLGNAVRFDVVWLLCAALRQTRCAKDSKTWEEGVTLNGDRGLMPEETSSFSPVHGRISYRRYRTILRVKGSFYQILPAISGFFGRDHLELCSAALTVSSTYLNLSYKEYPLFLFTFQENQPYGSISLPENLPVLSETVCDGFLWISRFKS